ncbi:MAG TPA: biopolymer transporter ExbD [Arcobacter sp.]|nr:biopolymer transporter ExbD [Arcobacter sp.]HIP55962.1 biopolymer transporter ExbD [Arcobacter sp.]
MRKREQLNLDLTPLIDVVFILIIFFLVTSSFKQKDFALNLTLPDAKAQQIEIEKKQLNIEVDEKFLSYMGEKISFLDLQVKLENIKNQKLPIIVKIDKKVRYDRVIEVLDLLQLNNLNNIALQTTSKE